MPILKNAEPEMTLKIFISYRQTPHLPRPVWGIPGEKDPRHPGYPYTRSERRQRGHRAAMYCRALRLILSTGHAPQREVGICSAALQLYGRQTPCPDSNICCMSADAGRTAPHLGTAGQQAVQRGMRGSEHRETQRRAKRLTLCVYVHALQIPHFYKCIFP